MTLTRRDFVKKREPPVWLLPRAQSDSRTLASAQTKMTITTAYFPTYPAICWNTSI